MIFKIKKTAAIVLYNSQDKKMLFQRLCPALSGLEQLISLQTFFTVIEAATEEALRNRKGNLEMRNAVAEINKKTVIRKIELFGSADKA